MKNPKPKRNATEIFVLSERPQSDISQEVSFQNITDLKKKIDLFAISARGSQLLRSF